MCVLSIKVPIRKKSGNLINDPRICISSLKIKLIILSLIFLSKHFFNVNKRY